MQDSESCPRRYPGLQEQLNPPMVFLQWWAHPEMFSEHSFISVTKNIIGQKFTPTAHWAYLSFRILYVFEAKVVASPSIKHKACRYQILLDMLESFY